MTVQPPEIVGPAPMQPAVGRDLALLVPDSVAAGVVLRTVEEAAEALLESAAVFDVYRGEGVADGTSSIAFRLVFRHPERTLKDTEVDQVVERVLEQLRGAHGVERRA